uniref:Uncharacterized protein n=1 Tax=Brassica oleracea TaxID=3712 RepID=A0A3P6BJ92_BRAOL|nr:unnamed protein product [Brassica oleracea]
MKLNGEVELQVFLWFFPAQLPRFPFQASRSVGGSELRSLLLRAVRLVETVSKESGKDEDENQMMRNGESVLFGKCSFCLQPIQQTPDGTSHGSQVDLYEIPYPAAGVYCRSTVWFSSNYLPLRRTLERIEENRRRADNRKQARFTPYEDSRNHRRTDHPTRIRGIIGELITLRATKAIITSALRIAIITTMVAESTYLTDHSLQTKTEKDTEQDPESLLIDYHPLERARMSLSDPVECTQQIPQLRMFGALSQEIGRMEDTLTRSNLKCLTHHLPSHHVSGLLHLTSRHRARPDPLVKSLQLHLQDAQLSSDCVMERH